MFKIPFNINATPNLQLNFMSSHIEVFDYLESHSGWGWKGPLEIAWFNPLPNEGQLQQIAQDRVQLGFDYFQVWTLHNLSLQPVTVFSHPCSKKVFS